MEKTSSPSKSDLRTISCHQHEEGYYYLYGSWNKLFMEFLQAGVVLNHVVDQQTLLLAFLEGYLDWLDVCVVVRSRLQLKHFENG
jgi:hypothetical protein